MRVLATFHQRSVHDRRVEMLADHLARLLPADARVLDVGCGDGLLSSLVIEKRPDVEIQGVDVMRRATTQIPVALFDGVRLPYADRTFDVLLFVDVLHHTTHPMLLLQDAKRVTRQAIVIKDHVLEGRWADPTLRVMDWVGNRPYGVALPYHYWTQAQWEAAICKVALTTEVWQTHLNLYPRAVNWLFGRSLHFIAKLMIVPE